MAGTLISALMAVAQLVLAWGFAQFVLWWRWGTAEHERAVARPAPTRHDYRFAFLVPALDEEAVIGETVAELRRLAPAALVIVVDDASDDRTGELAATAGAHVVRRELPEARRGKGAALNHGYRELARLVRQRGLPAERTIVGVMDADGRLSPNAIAEVAARFDDPRVGGVQLPVRIRNKRTLLARIQDFELWGMSAIAQMARVRTRSVSLGGNGQFTRLEALESVGGDPWSDALTEDLDLGIELTLRGWELDCAAAAWVSQQGVETLRALLRQRTRWFQGHMLCAGKARQLWETPGVARLTALETTVYLLTPVFVLLPWSIVFTLGLVLFGLNVAAFERNALSGAGVSLLSYAVFWYVLTFLPWAVAAVFYARRSESERVVAALAKGHLQVFYQYVNMAAVWLAVGRIALRRSAWAKTARVSELPAGALRRAA